MSRSVRTAPTLGDVRQGDSFDATNRSFFQYGQALVFVSATIPAMIDWSTCPAVEQDPARVSGAWVFRGTRVPVAAFFENLEDGASLSQFS